MSWSKETVTFVPTGTSDLVVRPLCAVAEKEVDTGTVATISLSPL